FSTDGLGETAPEEGTDLETIFDARLAKDGGALAQAMGHTSVDALSEKLSAEVVAPTFKQMYAAWSAKRWGAVRHLLTDFLWEAQQHWVRAYSDKGLTNKLDDLELSSVEVARV